MRGKLSEQDLTNYALNDGLEARERLYVESMLGASEECRNDVYKMLDMSALLERGFEQEAGRTVPRLTRSQREMLLNAKPRFEVMPFVRQAAATLSLAACVAFVAVNPAGWRIGERGHLVAEATKNMGEIVREVLGPDVQDLSQYVTPQSVSDDDSDQLQTVSSDGMPMPVVETICTPPTWKDAGDNSEVQ
jgi:hypothetical protein